MPIYVRRNGVLVDKATGIPCPLSGEIAAPIIMKPMPTYRSPIDGRVINSRQERKDDLKRHNCVEYEPSMSPTKGKFRNEHFCKKHGFQVSEEFR
jgi:hypothetical protein